MTTSANFFWKNILWNLNYFTHMEQMIEKKNKQKMETHSIFHLFKQSPKRNVFAQSPIKKQIIFVTANEDGTQHGQSRLKQSRLLEFRFTGI